MINPNEIRQNLHRPRRNYRALVASQETRHSWPHVIAQEIVEDL